MIDDSSMYYVTKHLKRNDYAFSDIILCWGGKRRADYVLRDNFVGILQQISPPYLLYLKQLRTTPVLLEYHIVLF